MTDDAIPAGMVAWAGADAAPADWDGGPVYARNGKAVSRPLYWAHRPDPSYSGQWDIIAYTPAASSDERDGAREVRTILIRAGMHEDANSATQLIPYSIAARAVSEALAASRPTDAGAGLLREALERIQDEPLHTLPIVTTQRMRNIASYALRGERLA